jgi:2-amino-4-hydroxy-6-hydroxymethyldihydropteridine diphosphokinase
MSFQALIGLGGNLNNPEETLKKAIKALDNSPGIYVAQVASFYQTKPFGLQEVGNIPNFVNTAALLKTELCPEMLLEVLLKTENQFGRARPLDGHVASRTLDLDLLFYEDEIRSCSVLEIPHPRLHERAFVLVPLNEIVPNWLHPTQFKTIADLYQILPSKDVQDVLQIKPLVYI